MKIKMKASYVAFASMLTMGAGSAIAEDQAVDPNSEASSAVQVESIANLPATTAGAELNARKRAQTDRQAIRSHMDENLHSAASAIALGL